MRKILLPFVAIIMLTLIGACSHENVLPEVEQGTNIEIIGRTLSFTASMPDNDNDPTTRVVAEEEADRTIALTWDMEDKIDLLFVQGTQKAHASTTVTGVDATKRKATFSVVIPTTIDESAPFNLYGVYGGGEVSTANPQLIELPAIDAATLSEENVGKKVMLRFEKSIDAAAMVGVVNFKHVGFLFTAKIKVMDGGSIDDIASVKLVGDDATNTNWAYNAQENYFNIETGIFTSNATGTNTLYLQNTEKDATNNVLTVRNWFPATGEEWQAIKLVVNNGAEDIATAYPKAARTLEAGNAYYLYGLLNSNLLSFTNQNFQIAQINEGFTFSPEAPNADEKLTFTFKAAPSSALHGYTGDVYIHTGVVVDDTWLYVPADWSQNIAKCKMTMVGDNAWSINFAPTIREWFDSGETAVNKLGIVIRSEDGTKKGVEDDYFVDVIDHQYVAFEPGAIKMSAQPAGLQHGINIIDNNTVTLVLYDRDTNGNRKEYAYVMGDFNNWTLSDTEQSQMYRDDAEGTWWITLTGLNSSTEYRFQYYLGEADGGALRLADAYSRKILDPHNDTYIPSSTYPEDTTYPNKTFGIVSVFKTVEDTYNWRVENFTGPDRGNMVIYEMLFRDFTDTGDINGAMQKLDYLQSLGVNAIELMPVQEFDGNDSWGYNPSFFFAMDKAYGTDRMYKEFIDACHERGMAVILDVVYNHATGANPLAKLYWDDSNNKTAPNNPWFNVDAPHPYSVFHDFNHESPLVRNFVKRNLTFLLEEYNIDGFRFDLTKGFTQNQSNESNAGNYDASRIAILKDYNNTIKSVKPDAYVILEHFCDHNEETELGNEGMMLWHNMTNPFSQSAMGYSANSDFSGLFYYSISRPANSLVSYMESHDEERIAYKQTLWGNGPLKTNLNARMMQLSTNAAFFFNVPGPKMIWQFGELGYDISIDQNGRTGRKPIKWEYYDDSHRRELHNTYSRLIELRNNHPELFTISSHLDWQVSSNNWDDGRFLTLKSSNDKKVVVVGNFTNFDKSFYTTFPSTGNWYNYMNRSDTVIDATTVRIDVPANGFKIYTSFAAPSAQ